jgi:biopolymer transport protein ExbD
MSEVVESGSRGKKGGSKLKRRSGIRLDMTPMVDVAFLLLTFFMLTTTLTTPQVMEISLPPDNKASVEVAQSNLITLRVRKDQTIFWNMGQDAPVKMQESQLRTLLSQHLKANPKLATLIKIDREAKYQTLVDIIDDLNVTQLDLGQKEKRFSLVAMDDKDQALVGNL